MSSTRLYGGRLLYRGRDEYGPIEVVDDGSCRSLHFGSEARQSAMLHANREHLQLSYTRAMSAALLFQPQPRRILLIGLGGGSLLRFLMRHYPDARIEAVELRESVVELARRYFDLPASARVHIADAAWFIHHGHGGEYDLILVDAFVGEGIADSVTGHYFHDACRARLSDNGVMAMNLWSRDSIDADELLRRIDESFEGRLLKLPVEGKENIVAIATMCGKPRQRLKQLPEQARALAERHGIEYPALLKALRRHNHGLFF